MFNSYMWPLIISLVKNIQKRLKKLIHKLHLVYKKRVHREIIWPEADM